MAGMGPGRDTGPSYDGPELVEEVRAGALVVRVVRPAEPDRLLDAPAVRDWNRADDYMPYWAYLWPGAYLVAEVVAGADLGGAREALEIGCGLGLAGLTALARGLSVQFTDYDAAPFPYILRSAGLAGHDASTFSASRLDWREPADRQSPLILGADVLYERRLVPLVAGVLARMLSPGGVALLADPYRASAEDLPAALGQVGLAFDVTTVEAHPGGDRSFRGTLHRVWRARDGKTSIGSSDPSG